MSQKGMISRSSRVFGTLGVLTLFSVPCAVNAQSTAPSPALVTLNYQNAPLQDVLKALFAQAGQPYAVDPGITGHVTVTMEGVSPDTALKAVLAASDMPLAFDHTDSYHIHAAPPTPAPAVAASSNTGNGASALPPPARGKQWFKVPLQKYDAGYIGSLFGSRGRTMVLPPNTVTAAGSAGAAGTTGAGGRGGGGYGGGGRGGGGRRRGGG